MKRMDKYFGMSPRIARWKLNNGFENLLGKWADKSEWGKRLYVFYYQLFDAKYYVGGRPFINKQLDTFKVDWKGLRRKDVARDMIYCLHRFGINFQDYWIYGFVNKSHYCRTSFVPDKLRYHYCDILNAPGILPLMTDKYACYQKYKEFFKREVLGCYQLDDQDTFLAFADRHERFIFKPLTEHSGHGIRIISVKDEDMELLFTELISKGPFIVEELIVQGKETALMHPASVNSFRVATFVVDEEVHIFGITWRIGVGNAVMDNAGAGGIYASVNPVHGFVQTDAMNYRGEHYSIHPNSKVRIIGYQLPEWGEALSLIKAMATKVKGTTLIAWDIAYSDKGWLMVEANENGDWSIIQSNKQEGKKAELHSYMDRYFKNDK